MANLNQCASAVLVASVVAATMGLPGSSKARVCSVFSHEPCFVDPYDQFCSVFDPRPCAPEPLYPFGETLQLTISSRAAMKDERPRERGRKDDRKLTTIGDVFEELRSCWVPPAEQESHSGTQMSVRLSFKRNGELFGKPRLSYLTPGTSDAVRRAYWDAIMAAFARCTPLGLSDGLGGALAGRPFAIRFVDDRNQKSEIENRKTEVRDGNGVANSDF
jgi:hypothetical protein